MNDALVATLSLAVPLHIMGLEAKGGPSELQRHEAQEFGQVLSERADTLQFGGKKGEAGKLFDRLALAIAVLSFQPGGIKCFGMHFEGRRPMERSDAP